MQAQFKYGFTWISLAGSFLVLAALALGLLWLAFTVEQPWRLAGAEIPPASVGLILLVIGGFFAVAAGIVVSLMFQQRGMAKFILLDSISLSLPVLGAGKVDIPLAALNGWQVIEKPTHKTLRLDYAGQQYAVESRLMASAAQFDELVDALRSRAAAKERPSEKKK